MFGLLPSRASSVVTMLLVVLVLAGCRREEPAVYEARKAGTLNFSKHIAPITLQNCASCHRPGQPAPFDLISFEDIRKHADEVATVTRSRYMPPWLPVPGHGDFLDARTLTATEIGMIGQWVAEGCAQGDPADLPPTPKWPQGWQLGVPDLVATMPEPFVLAADGPDLYRNFVIPLPLERRRYVRAVELDPGNGAIVHHAFIRFDATPQSRRYDSADPQPGFDGVHGPSSAKPPDGFFLSWQPGKVPSENAKGFSWPLEARSDVVLQMHLQPSGKPESIQARVAFYFSDEPPTAMPMKVWLSSYRIDIPAGSTNYILEEFYTLPGDVDVLGILPHAHYLGKELRCDATRPDQTEVPLLWIKRWDFNWQGDYRYAKPIFLPKGTVVRMRYTYDNSSANPANPNHPPRRVTYGLQSSDEMGELWLQVLPREPADRTALLKDHETRVIQDTFAYNQYLLSQNPRDGHAHAGLGKAYYFAGRLDQAVDRFKHALALDAKLDEAHYYLGLIRRQGDLTAAVAEFSAAVTVNPENPRAHGNLGLIHNSLGNLTDAEKHLRAAVQLDPADSLARETLGALYAQLGNFPAAEAQFRAVLELDPGNATVREQLRLLKSSGDRSSP